MKMRRIPLRIWLAVVVAAALAWPASATPHGAVVIKDTCFFAPGDIPGVNKFFETRGQLVLSPNGGFHLTCHGSLPEGASAEAMRIDLPCESPGFPNARGQIVVTPSGRVNAVCQASA